MNAKVKAFIEKNKLIKMSHKEGSAVSRDQDYRDRLAKCSESCGFSAL